MVYRWTKWLRQIHTHFEERRPLPLGGRLINPDDVAREISKRTGIDYGLANLAAAQITEGEVFDAVVQDDKSVSIETVLSSANFAPILDIAEARGVKIGMMFVAVASVASVDLVLRRIETRVASGLHHVPEVKVRERWPKVLANLRIWAPRVDALLVFSNNFSGKKPVLVASKFEKTKPVDILNRTEIPDVVACLEPVGTGP